MIHVIGNAAIDTIFRVDRFPLPGETIVARDASEDIGGKGANQAVMAARGGAKVRLVAAIGNDSAGARIRAALDAEGVVTDGLRIWAGPTDRSSIYVDARGENTIVSVTGAARAFDPLAADTLQDIGPGDFVLCQGNLATGVLAACMATARDRRAVTVLNPSPLSHLKDFDWRLAEVVVLNEVEAQELSSSGNDRDAAHELLAAGAGTVVITLGSRGAVMSGAACIKVEAPKVDAIDTTGAGDVFCGMLTAARAQGLSWRSSLVVATEAAAISVTRRGVMASFPATDEIRETLSKELGRSTN